ncbi:DNA translocase FtsK [Lactobacillaceae bacterium Melli_B3]
MNHYDGPAFYRRFLQKDDQNSQQDDYSNNKMTNSNRTAMRNERPEAKSVSNFRTNGENTIAKMTQNFQPKGNYARRVTSDNYLSSSKLGHYYLKLLNELNKPDEDCVLFDDGIDTRASSNVIAFDEVDESAESMAAERQQDVPKHVVPDKHVQTFESAVTSHYARSTSDEDYYQRLHDSATASVRPTDQSGSAVESNRDQPNSEPPAPRYMASKSAVPSSKPSLVDQPSEQRSDVDTNHRSRLVSHSTSSASAEPVDAKPSVSHFESSADSSDAKPASEQHASAEVEAPVQKPVQSEKLTPPKRGLGHSLSSILDNENDAQKDVEFFKDELPEQEPTSPQDTVPKATPKDVQSVVADSAEPDGTDSADDAEPVSNDDHDSISSGSEYEHGYQFPSFTLLNEPHREDDEDLDDWIINQSEILERTLHAFHVNAEVVDWTNGPTVTQFQVKLALGVKVSKITNLNDDLKMALAAKDIRIEAPIPGRTTVGVEIPNPKPRPVMLSEVLDSNVFRQAESPLTIALGVDLTGQPQVTSISKMPHGLIAGATGSGKSVFINSLLVSLLYKATPAQLRLLLIDPKAVELAPYNNIPHLLAPVISEPNEASAALKWAVKEMDERYEKLAAGGARNIEQFNEKAEQSGQLEMKMPYVVIIIDELADLMMVASTEVQDYIVRITQKARAAGIHLIVATQRPSVDIVTGTIKNNIPTRIAFMVSSQVDSRTIIDTAGAERLLGKGDMLYLGNGKSQPLRIQGTFVTNEEIERVTAAVRTQGTPKYAFNPKSLLKKVNMVQQQDEIMPEVLAYIAKEQTVSTSKLQRVFSIGYNRAASLIDDLEQQNYISGQHGSKPREVYLTEEDYKKLNL